MTSNWQTPRWPGCLEPARLSGETCWCSCWSRLANSFTPSTWTGRCTFINRAGAAQLGYTPAERVGHNKHEMAHHSQTGGANYPELLCPNFKAIREALSCRIDSELFWRKNGSAFAIECSSCPIIGSGAVQGAAVTVIDISARRQAADALRQAHDVLELRMDERTQALLEALMQLRQLSAYEHIACANGSALALPEKSMTSWAACLWRWRWMSAGWTSAWASSPSTPATQRSPCGTACASND